ncbi:uncharacterized protein LOC112589923 isoform X1 [Harpegnathos saltator]|uniref:uncharacterized protein LOC112589923 isoform X1 n=1 Tax=Harpegnathos saltator TaxID=610380 RepID=UPI000DBEDA8C|nr:uncharacterized protein LOC112589923 isoform X1 [Harpegnathos saltator]
MKITCFITICTYLSSIVSTNEIRPLNGIMKSRLHEDLAFKDFIVKKEINTIPEVYPDINFTLQKPQAKVQIETLQKPKKTRELKLWPEQHHHYDSGHSRRLLKRSKTRSIGDTSYELGDNQLNELTKSIPQVHDESSIYIEPILRVTTKKNIFDSIMDILHQLLNMPKNELGSVVGPIQIPGSKRKIYLRLMESVKSNHVMVRFITQVPISMIDVEPKHIIPILPVIDPVATLLNNQHTVLTDAMFASSRHLPRNTNHTSGKILSPQLNKPSVLNLLKHPSKDLRDTGLSDTEVFLPSKGEENKTPLVELNLKNHENSFLSESNSYYQAGEDARNQMKLLNDTTTAIENDDSKDTPGTWYELSTHRLPLRQIAPLYPLTSVEHTEHTSSSSSSPSYADAYKMPSDVLTGSSLYTSPHTQLNNVNSASESYINSYDQHYDTSSSYSMSYSKPDDVHTSLNNYSTYQKQNEFNGGPSSYTTSYQNQNEFNNVPNSYLTSYRKQNDLYGAFSSYLASYDKPNNVQLSSNSSISFSHEKQNSDQISPNSNDALHVIDPPPYFPGYQKSLGNYVNQSSTEHSAIHQPRYILQNLNENSLRTNQRGDQGELKRDKNESSFQQNRDSLETNDRDRKQPIRYKRKNTAWNANLVKIADNHHETKQPFENARETSHDITWSSFKEGDAVDRQDIGKRRDILIPITKASKCLVFNKKNECEQVKPTLTIHWKTLIKTIKK